ncbi:hypothetical protein FC18_GL000186 [Lacticaseibacillus sharpeae JCM 1186 = DSM 20505]|uniref:Uncharacterized protein n=1 Tax=Lacticaseibacillus sharpeae JCM 1186 = DSM 20505 TaxID=1291052 RepID=A0A0R1ZPA9_9LACO|nr:hypothetical protein FC18_GL000186 [Lacticaseibacillus sharpeae JCM 1186 = DSM 20505]
MSTLFLIFVGTMLVNNAKIMRTKPELTGVMEYKKTASTSQKYLAALADKGNAS